MIPVEAVDRIGRLGELLQEVTSARPGSAKAAAVQAAFRRWDAAVRSVLEDAISQPKV
jgi:hypothetical protein